MTPEQSRPATSAMYDPQDTIAAIASPSGGAARGIVRLSGPRAVDCIEPAWRSRPDVSQRLSALRRATMLAGFLEVDGFNAAIPCDLYAWPGLRSYTRQPAVEVHTIGSPPILQAVLRTVCRHGARLAGPGEFTLRAFLAGRLDLTQAEAVLGVIDSRSGHELDVALAQLAGGLGGPLGGLRNSLVDLLAHLEAGLDFVEDDIEFIARDELRRQLSLALAQVRELVERTRKRAVLKGAVRVVLVGRPNVGKSSLFNALLGRSAAIVSPSVGTTRDYLIGELTIGDVPIELVDTAGLGACAMRSAGLAEQSIDERVEDAAERASVRQRHQSDIEILCLDSTRPLTDWERTEIGTVTSRGGVIVWTKMDQPSAMEPLPEAVLTSSTTRIGLDELCSRLRTAALDAGRDQSDVVATTAARCHESLRAAAGSLQRALDLIDEQAGEELVAAELRATLDDLGQVVGAVYTEDLLDRIFSRFCIGK